MTKQHTKVLMISEPIRLTILILSFVIIGGAFFALLLFMLVFPLWNRLFGTRLPSFRYGEIEEDTTVTNSSSRANKASQTTAGKKRTQKQISKPIAKTEKIALTDREEPSQSKAAFKGAQVKSPQAKVALKSPVARVPARPIRAKEEKKDDGRIEQKIAAAPVREKQNNHVESVKPAVRTPRTPDLHKNIPTVRVDTLFAPVQKEQPLTVKKIDAEGRRATKTDSANNAAKSMSESATAPKKPTARKKKQEGEPETVVIE